MPIRVSSEACLPTFGFATLWILRMSLSLLGCCLSGEPSCYHFYELSEELKQVVLSLRHVRLLFRVPAIILVDYLKDPVCLVGEVKVEKGLAVAIPITREALSPMESSGRVSMEKNDPKVPSPFLPLA
ncbi:hypothetical protein FNV43_RR21737 [Rhamnella rubrinervis]|uniref:Uncharacterized protein n=1 Tax=Rhamnella rubrinervis TaxID=2594499 RepID=A0A8K0GMH5_9ROSA|nr:hypothetical protein FNV43_RR21737 [Rhamnella rubrinervis]